MNSLPLPSPLLAAAIASLALIAACNVVPPPAGETRALNEARVRCGSEAGETSRCDLTAGEVCCIDGDNRTCMRAEACESTALHCDDPTDCPAGQICCGDVGTSECRPASECSGKPSCVSDWNCATDQICRENFFVSDIFVCDE